MIARQIELDSREKQIEGQLCRLLGVAGEPSVSWTPVANLAVSMAMVDREAAATTGTSMRADVAFLHTLRDRLNGDTLPAVRNGMQQTSGLSGAASPAERKLLQMIAPAHDECEEQTRKSQLDLLLADKTMEAEEDIRQAAREVESRLRQAAVAKHEWDSWQANVCGLREKQTSEMATTFNVSAAQLHAFQAESDAIAALVAWEIAQVKLQQAQGLLAQRMRLSAAVCGWNVVRTLRVRTGLDLAASRPPLVRTRSVRTTFPPLIDGQTAPCAALPPAARWP